MWGTEGYEKRKAMSHFALVLRFDSQMGSLAV